MKKRLVSIVISMLMIATVLSVAGTVNATDWTMLGGNPERTGYSPDEAPDTNNTLWVYDIPGWIASSAVVVNDIIYVGGSADRVVALNPDGTEKWTFDTDGPVSSTPAVSDGKIVFGEDATIGDIYCVNTETGLEEWSFATGHWTKYSPVIDNGLVYVQSYDGYLYCLYLENGTQKWSYIGATGEIAVSNGYLYTFSEIGGNFLILNAETGALDNSIYIDEWALSVGTPLIDGNFAYFGVSGFTMDFKVYCIDLIAGNIEWSYTLTEQATSSCAVDDDNVYIAYQGGSWPDYYGTILCLNKTTGSLIWDFSTTVGAISGSPSIADGKIYFGSLNNNIYCLNITDGSQIWSLETTQDVPFSPAISNGKMYIGSKQEGNLYCFGDNDPPYIPNAPSGPTEGIVGFEVEFEVVTTDPNGDDIAYMIDWGDGTTPVWSEFYTSGTSYSKTHSYETIDNYEITVNAKDIYDSESGISNAATIDIINNVPDEPDIDGPDEANIDEEQTFTISSTDSDGHQLTYTVDWDDGSVENFGPYDSGASFEAKHEWDTVGSYTIEVTASDSWNVSDPGFHEIDIIDPQPELAVEIQTGVGSGVIAKITNTGDAEATNVEFSMSITGGIFGLIDVNVTESIVSLAAGEEVEIPSESVIGLGSIDIIANVECDEGISNEDTATGLQLLFITIVS